MKKIILSAFIGLISFTASFGQCTIRGKVTDENGSALIGVNIVLKSNSAVGAATDFDGNFSIEIKELTDQTLVVSYISFKTIEEVIHPLKGEVIIKNFVMAPATQTVSEVVITAKAVKSKEYFMESVKRKSATSIDYISAETMKKTGDASVVTAVARVPGVSTNGGFITVRGIGDRYVKTGINGSRIPTLDPFTNNIKLDIFPASLVDNIMITKTASPDLPGDWAGAYLSVETKDYPEKLSLTAETSIGYNGQSTFKDVLSSQRSSTDWLGYDNNFRDHDHDKFTMANTGPTTYQELVALGLGSFYAEMGITASTPWNDTYFKLGLVQLGLLAPAQFNDDVAFNNARNLYLTGPYKAQAFREINSAVPATGKSFPSNWNTTVRKAPLNFTQSFSVGNQTTFLGKPLGFLFGFRYGSSIQYDPNSVTNRASVVGDENGNLIPSISSSLDQQVSRETNGWSALMNLAYKLNSNNSISLLFMPNLTGVNNVRYATDNGDIKNIVMTQSQFYEQRRQLVYQLKTVHYMPVPKIKIESNASYTKGNSSVPDFKNVQYWKFADSTYQIGGSIGDGIHRYYRYLSDDLLDSRLSLEIPLGSDPILPRKFKIGGAYQRNDRTSDQYDYQVMTQNSIVMTNNNLNEPLDINNFGINTTTDSYGQEQSTINLYYKRDDSPANHTFGKSETKAAFAMLDFTIFPRLRFSGGMRVEKTNVLTDVVKFDSLGLAPNDPRREYKSGLPAANPGKLDEISYLPSANVIFKIVDDELAPVNARINFSRTVARPSIRELSDVAVFDYEYRAFVFGNSNLKMVSINNYDFRLEDYFKSGDNVSISLFHKDFKNHIELINSGGYSWHNVDKSQVSGIELEGKKIITKHFDFRANVAFIKSETEFVRTRIAIGSGGIREDIPQDTVTRSMFGQAPYIINGILTYSADSIGLSVSLSYNVQGARLVVASDNKEIPDVYELPRHLADIKVTQSLGKHFSASLTVRDILSSPIRRSYKYADGYHPDYDKYVYGTNYVLGISYKL